MALKRLGLDEIWWMVSPQNPLKPAAGMAPFAKRLAGAQAAARHPRIKATDIETRLGSSYTAETLVRLARRLPRLKFVWLMGADNLADFDRWRAWEEIFALMPIAVLDRPGFRLKARAGKAAQRFAAYQVDESDARGLATLAPPAWTILTHRLSGLSSSELRAWKAKGKQAKGKDKKTTKKSKRD